MGNSKYDLVLGDCLTEMGRIPDNSVDMVLCDLPFGCTRNKWDIALPFDALWAQWKRVIKSGCVIALFAKQRFTADVICSNRKMFRYKIVWEKTGGTDFLNAKVKPLSAHEDICIFYNKKPKFNPQMRDGFLPYKRDRAKGNVLKWNSNVGDFNGATVSKSDDGLRYPLDVVRYAYSQGTGHPTAKPVGLLEWLIKSYTQEGATVLDNCMGGGSTGVACMNTGRRFLGIEKEPKYFNIAYSRIKDAAASV